MRTAALLLVAVAASCTSSGQRCDRLEPNHSGVMECHIDGPYSGPVLTDTTGGRDIDLSAGTVRVLP